MCRTNIHMKTPINTLTLHPKPIQNLKFSQHHPKQRISTYAPLTPLKATWSRLPINIWPTWRVLPCSFFCLLISCSPINWGAQWAQQFPTNRHCHFQAHPPPAVVRRRRARAPDPDRVKVSKEKCPYKSVKSVRLRLLLEGKDYVANALVISCRHGYHQARCFSRLGEAS